MGGAYIKEMEKPKNCGECPLMRGSYCAITDNFYFEEADYDPTSCPIEELDLVRCKECKYIYTDEGVTLCGVWGKYAFKDGFCYQGERRNDD